MTIYETGAERRARLARSRLYLVCGAQPNGRDLPDVLSDAIIGGVDIVQVREKDLSDDELIPIVSAVRDLCTRLGALLIVNDRPSAARDAGADGVHVGQDDTPTAQVREIVGDDMLIGLSTHSPEQIDAVDANIVDYIGVGPIHETPTKLGRPAVGTQLVRYAAIHAPVPFFAIGGLHAGNVQEVLDVGATRICVLRAIASADDPEAAARALRKPIDMQ